MVAIQGCIVLRSGQNNIRPWKSIIVAYLIGTRNKLLCPKYGQNKKEEKEVC